MSRVPLPAMPCPSQTGERGLQGLGLGLLHVSFFKSIFWSCKVIKPIKMLHFHCTSSNGLFRCCIRRALGKHCSAGRGKQHWLVFPWNATAKRSRMMPAPPHAMLEGTEHRGDLCSCRTWCWQGSHEPPLPLYALLCNCCYIITALLQDSHPQMCPKKQGNGIQQLYDSTSKTSKDITFYLPSAF